MPRIIGVGLCCIVFRLDSADVYRSSARHQQTGLCFLLCHYTVPGGLNFANRIPNRGFVETAACCFRYLSAAIWSLRLCILTEPLSPLAAAGPCAFVSIFVVKSAIVFPPKRKMPHWGTAQYGIYILLVSSADDQSAEVLLTCHGQFIGNVFQMSICYSPFLVILCRFIPDMEFDSQFFTFECRTLYQV